MKINICCNPCTTHPKAIYLWWGVNWAIGACSKQTTSKSKRNNDIIECFIPVLAIRFSWQNCLFFIYDDILGYRIQVRILLKYPFYFLLILSIEIVGCDSIKNIAIKTKMKKTRHFSLNGIKENHFFQIFPRKVERIGWIECGKKRKEKKQRSWELKKEGKEKWKE